jgi:hypothetical protein
MRRNVSGFGKSIARLPRALVQLPARPLSLAMPEQRVTLLTQKFLFTDIPQISGGWAMIL